MISHAGFNGPAIPFARPRRGLSLFFALLLAGLTTGGMDAAAGETLKIAVVVSSNLKPYLDAVQGFQSHLEKEETGKSTVYFLDPEHDAANTLLTGKLQNENFALITAVGPEAMAYLWNTFTEEVPRKLYCVVLNPDRVVPGHQTLCGVPLNIPVHVQIEEFIRQLPRLRRVGLIYDPANNAAFAAAAVAAARPHGIEIIHLQVRGRNEILRVLDSRWKNISALWVIPDATVISESLVLFIIKGAIANNVAVFGFNRFFTDSGAAIALVCDYEAIGRQTAALASDILKGLPCPPAIPAYEAVVNKRVLKTLGILPARQQDSPVGAGTP